MSRTAVVIEVPDAEPIAGSWRRELTKDGALGMPPHVTVLFPFVALDELDSDVVAQLSIIAAHHPAFDFALTDTKWFGEDVLWLSPEPASSFRALIEDVEAAFPMLRPYGGAHEETVPHLTLGASSDRAAMRSAEHAAQALLPVYATALALAVFAEQADGRWARQHLIPLGESAIATG